VNLANFVEQFEMKGFSIDLIVKMLALVKQNEYKDLPGAPIIHNGVRVTILTTIEKICSRI
jgi:hypothetical protein